MTRSFLETSILKFQTDSTGFLNSVPNLLTSNRDTVSAILILAATKIWVAQEGAVFRATLAMNGENVAKCNMGYQLIACNCRVSSGALENSILSA